MEIARPDGYLRANGLQFRFGSGLFVQNSGTAGDTQSTTRAGFTAGSGGVTLTSTAGQTAAAPAAIINGRITDASAGIVSGIAVIPRLVIRGAQTQNVTLDARSTVNGCLIVGQSCRFDTADPTPIPVVDAFFPVQDTIREALEPRPGEGDPTEGGVTRVNAPLIDLPDFVGYGLQPTIDEPVTGAGNDDLLVGDTDECAPGATDPRCAAAGSAPTTRP
ncbi:MAG: hypothetical protein EOP59_14585 [Sphingomonadales bacterium]|nr:MAG: hypothetical protein EOP59_14585 [Sphingomonadales bacterium]